MPQLMPLFWLISLIMIFYMFYNMYMLFNNIKYFYLCKNMNKEEGVNIFWKW